MKANWIIQGHHLALKAGGNVYHPNAKDVFTLLSKDNGANDFGLECDNPSVELPQIRYSKIGSRIFLDLSNDEKGRVILQIFAIRRQEYAPVDLIEGTIVDQCLSNNTWFFLTENTIEAQEMLTAAEIKSCGPITMRQYLKLVELNVFKTDGLLRNNVNIASVQAHSNISDTPPVQLKANLFPYQQTGYVWLKQMLDSCNGCILGDEMGLGKTMQVIATMLKLKSEGSIPMLVIAPISLLANWKRECAKFAPSLRTMVHYGNERVSNYRDFKNYDVVITSYTSVVRDLYMLNMVKWEMAVLDEAQSIKNPDSARTKACKALNRNKSLAVSGTPFENHVSDIWSLVDFVQPGLLGPLKEYSAEITDDVEGGEKVEPILSPLMLRRLVADVAKDLPEKVVSTQPLSMSDKESEEYAQFLNALKASCNADSINLGMLQHLRIYCTHPYASKDGGHGDPAEVSVKYQRLCEIVEEVASRNEKVIVFTSYKRMFDIFKEDIPRRFGLPIWSINGETPVEERQAIVDKFNGLDGSAMLVLNPRAAGTGLNITGANHVIHYNLEWNPSLEDQSSARAYRRGQQKTVFVYRLYYENTIEQAINERIERKRDIASTAIIGTDGTLDRADILRALELIPTIRKQ